MSEWELRPQSISLMEAGFCLSGSLLHLGQCLVHSRRAVKHLLRD